MYPKGRGNTNDNYINISNFTEITGGFKAISDNGFDFFSVDMFYICFTGFELLNFFFINVKTNSLEIFFWKSDNQWQADIAESDDTNFCVFDIYFIYECFR